MKVLYDHQSFTGMTYGGVSRYFFDLMRSFAKRQDIDFELSLRLSNNEYLDQASFSSHLRYRGLAQVRNVNRVASVLNRLHSLRRLRAGQFDVFHPTYYHRYFLNALGNKPFVLTFHDAASERFGDIYPDLGEGLYEIKKKLIDRADAVIAVSEFSKQEILHFFPVNPDKVSVVHLGTAFGTEPLNVADSRTITPEPFPYVLYVGKRRLYKNFDGFFRAMQPLMQRHPDLHIVCAGGGLFNSDEQAMFHNARLDQRVHYRPVTDAGLLSLYQHARAFVFPSLNEGFGIPVLEAFSGDCPVLLSDRSSLPEVGASAAVYFDPEDEQAMGDAIERVITDEALRADLIAKGRERLRDFSCDKTAQQTLDIYRTLC
jgi:glycosyltransferase involved in cell wall biosynthesis